MNIGNGIENLTQIVPAQTAPVSSAKANPNSAQEPPAPAKLDQAVLSETGTQAAQSAPDSDVRLDKVASIQNALAAGTYRVPASQVAQKLIDSALAPEQ